MTQDDSSERPRGFFGRARDLLARVVERGLHLPDAAERIRAAVFEPPPQGRAPEAFPTLTLAEIYLAQGHRERAITTLERVLERDPEHAAARALLARLEGAPEEATLPAMPPEVDEAKGPPPPSPDELAASVAAERDAANRFAPEAADACVAVLAAPTTLFVYWHVRDATRAFAERAARAATARPPLALRVLVVVPSWDGPTSTLRDIEIAQPSGDALLEGVPEGAVVRVAVGLVCDEGFFPIAHSPAFELGADATWPARPTALLRRTARGAEPVTVDDADAPVIAHALAQAAEAADRVELGGA